MDPKLKKVVELRQDGTCCSFLINHEKLRDFFGCDVTFVGALDQYEVVAVGKRQPCLDDIENPFCKNKNFFEDEVKGNILLVGSDDNGLECDVPNELLEFSKQLLGNNPSPIHK